MTPLFIKNARLDGQPVDITLAAGDELIVYGHRDRLDEIHHPSHRT